MRIKVGVLAAVFLFMFTIITGFFSYRLLTQKKKTDIPVAKLSMSLAAEKPAALKSDGTFIQWWLVKDWDDKMWQKEFKALKEVGMQYVILEPLAFYSFDPSSEEWVTETVYPTQIPGFREKKGYGDIVDACLRNAEKAGFKVFLGLNFSDEWWSKRHDSAWINARVQEGNLIADELWDKYKSKYTSAFYGWYWCWETDNVFFKRLDPYNSAGILSRAISLFTSHLNENNIRLPVMLSPYMNWMLGTPVGNASLWEYILANSGLTEGDILCPQDSIGAGGLNLKNFKNWFASLRKAVDKTPGIKLWANTEIFRSSDWTAETVDKFINQMKELAPYVDDFVTFSYSHYYSPNIVNPGFHIAYQKYLEAGVMDNGVPSVPGDFKYENDANGNVVLSWQPSSDESGVCGYLVFRNGRRIADIQAPRTGGVYKPGPETLFVDSDEAKPKNPVYEVQAYDFSGNLSVKTPKLSVNIN